MSRKLYVGNIPYETSEADLQQLFEQAGSVESVRVMRDKATGQARGFAFVEMASDPEAQTAIQKLHEQPFGGRTLTVNEAKPMVTGGGSDRRGGGFGHRTESRW